MNTLRPLTELDSARFEAPAILKKVALAARQLGELKGAVRSVPQQRVLINTLALQEAKDSSAIENIVTTHDRLFRVENALGQPVDLANKEVLRYRQALETGYTSVRESGLITGNDIIKIQAVLEGNNAGWRKLPGTSLKDSFGRTVYTPPQEHPAIVALMEDLERFINDDALYDADPLIKMALIHHQFESIHPFYDGNGRTGRILNVLYLAKQQLLGSPVLYLSRHIVRTKGEYYRLLQGVRERDEWEAWVLYMLTAVEQTAISTIATIEAIHSAMLDAKRRIRSNHKFYSQDLINHLFSHPYTKISYFANALRISRPTASNHLEALTTDGLLEKIRIGRSNYFINSGLYTILTTDNLREGSE